MLQRSDDWFKARLGRFTASEIYKLMGVKGLGETGLTYAFDKACEVVFGKDEDSDFTSFDMQRGIELEPLAFKKFKELKALDFIDVQETTFFPFGKDAGASPDGLVGKDAVLEIKCPKRNKLLNLIDKGVEAIDQKYIYQMQMQMLCSNSIKCYFFNYGIFNGQEYWHELEILRDEVIIEKMKQRINEAIVLRDNYIISLQTKKQF